MNRFIRHSKYLMIFGLCFLSGCDKYLEVNPDNRVELNTLEKAAQLLTNSYTSAAYTFTEWMGDNVSYTTGTTKLPEHDQAYNWEDVIAIGQDTPAYFWLVTYDAIAHANEVLAIVDELPGDKAHRDAVKGEAYLTRAYGHFMLVNLFAKHYNEETADNDLGIPYVLEPETEFIKQYDRNTVEEVYDLIEDDILQGLKYVDGSFYANSGKYHFTMNSALAFASRFYLFKGDYEKCIEYSSEMLGEDPSIFVKDISRLLDETPNGLDFIAQFAAPTDPSNLLVIRNVTNYPITVGYWPRPALLQAIYNSNPWGKSDNRASDGYPIFERGSGLAIGKYEFLFERSSLTSNVGNYYTIMNAFRGEEVLLNRAESYIQLNQVNLAIADLQVLVSLRYADNPTVNLATLRAAYQTSNNQVAALSYTIDERQKEFMHEGLRWFDIKRFGFPVAHDEADGSLIFLEADDKRKVIQIPQSAIDVGGLAPNPR